ncbi:uncharacterized protein [Drosophila kikkawai]|uniref:Peptidase aspartic putative domain-containing protein n=1 Tax=Drosophila kikkawai TaxID=30033 RepID=A0ABM4GNB5_DROKI
MQSYRCRVCRGIHPLRKCRQFRRLSAEKRLRAVLANRYCPRCLAHVHSDGSCRRGDRCKTCGQDHHTLLHLSESPMSSRQSRPANRRSRDTVVTPRPSSAAPRPSSTAPRASSDTPRHSSAARPGTQPTAVTAPSLSSLLQRHSVNILPTALVRIHTGTQSFDTAALIDPCTPMSCIDASLAAAFRLPTTNVGGEQICSATIGSKIDSAVRLDVVFKIEPRVRIRTPVRELSDAVRAHFRDITLADERFYRPASISVILGADMYPRVIRPGFRKIDDGLPVTQSTIFGWIVSGACHQP